MKTVTILAAAMTLCTAAIQGAEPESTNAPPKPDRKHRYLVVVETSKSMAKRTEGIAHTVLDVVGSGLKGQVKQGDSVGLWTFNEELYTGKFPVKTWGPSSQSKVATSIVEFLEKQKFEKEGLPEKMLPTLSRVITNSELITVVLISSGSVDLRGTGFDEQINATYNQWRTQQQKKKMPFVTLLRARKGAVTDYAASPSPWPAELPPVPPEPAAPAAPLAAAPAPKKILAPLYFSGKKTEPQLSPLPATTAATNASPGAAAAGQIGNPGTGATNLPSATATVSLAPSSSNAPAALSVARPQEPPKVTANISSNRVAATANPPAATEPAAPKLAADEPAVAPKTPAAEASIPALMDAASPVAAATPANGFPTNTVLMAALGLCVPVFLALWIPRAMRRRARPASEVSLITRSLSRTTR